MEWCALVKVHDSGKEVTISSPCEIIHVTTVHKRGDTRIRLKELTSLARWRDRRVMLLVQDGLGDDDSSDDAVRIVDVGAPPRGRLRRCTYGWWRLRRELAVCRPRVVHFHDPELIPLGLWLRLAGTKVIYDVHEDLPRQILTKGYLVQSVRRPIAGLAAAAEWLASRAVNGIVTATPKIAERFPAHKTVVVQNFPLLSELWPASPRAFAQRPTHVAYVGNLADYRSSWEMVQAMGIIGDPQVRLQLAGEFDSQQHKQQLTSLPGWQSVDYHWWASRPQVAELLGNVRAGLVLFHPLPNHLAAQPNKMFEYMAAGLPVIASDFPLWREIVEGAGCGLLVDPQDPAAIAEAISWVASHPDEAEAMGRRGRQAVEEKYNWEQESKKLIELYQSLL